MSLPLINPLDLPSRPLSMGMPALGAELKVVDEEGYFYFVDRKKDVIKRAGENVSASEAEAVIVRHPAVLDAAVVGVPDPVRDEAVRALVILREGARAGEADIIAWCRERLAKFKVPEAVEIRTEFPRTSVGKIQKHILRAEVRARLADGKA